MVVLWINNTKSKCRNELLSRQQSSITFILYTENTTHCIAEFWWLHRSCPIRTSRKRGCVMCGVECVLMTCRGKSLSPSGTVALVWDGSLCRTVSLQWPVCHIDVCHRLTVYSKAARSPIYRIDSALFSLVTRVLFHSSLSLSPSLSLSLSLSLLSFFSLSPLSFFSLSLRFTHLFISFSPLCLSLSLSQSPLFVSLSP